MERHSAICCLSISVIGNYSGLLAAACGLPILVGPPQAAYPFLGEVQTLPPTVYPFSCGRRRRLTHSYVRCRLCRLRRQSLHLTQNICELPQAVRNQEEN